MPFPNAKGVMLPTPDEGFIMGIEKGKYELIHWNDGRFECLRYGETWRSLTGDKLVLCMMQEIERLRNELHAMKEDGP